MPEHDGPPRVSFRGSLWEVRPAQQVADVAENKDIPAGVSGATPFFNGKPCVSKKIGGKSHRPTNSTLFDTSILVAIT